MKRIVTALMMVLVICVMLSGCSKSGKPKDMNEETYEIGKRVAEVVQDFLDAKITAQEALDKLDIMYDRLKGLKFDEKDQRMAEIRNDMIQTKTLGFSISIRNYKLVGGSVQSISDDLKELKDYLGLK